MICGKKKFYFNTKALKSQLQDVVGGWEGAFVQPTSLLKIRWSLISTVLDPFTNCNFHDLILYHTSACLGDLTELRELLVNSFTLGGYINWNRVTSK